MRHIIVALTALAMTTGFAAADTTMITKQSANDVKTTMDRLEDAVTKAGATVFARVDHAAGASKVGMDLAPMELLIFGNPKLGTPIIQSSPEAGLDLPIKVLVWQDGDDVRIGYLEPEALKARHGTSGADKSFKMMSGALDKLTGVAAKAQ